MDAATQIRWRIHKPIPGLSPDSVRAPISRLNSIHLREFPHGVSRRTDNHRCPSLVLSSANRLAHCASIGLNRLTTEKNDWLECLKRLFSRKDGIEDRFRKDQRLQKSRRSREDLEDFQQECVKNCWEGVLKQDPGNIHCLEAYLSQSIENAKNRRFRDEIRAKTRGPLLQFVGDNQEIMKCGADPDDLTDADTPEESAQRDDAQKLALEVIDSMPPKQRAVLKAVLHAVWAGVFDARDRSRIALELGISERTLAVHLSRAMHQLRAKLTAAGFHTLSTKEKGHGK